MLDPRIPLSHDLDSLMVSLPIALDTLSRAALLDKLDAALRYRSTLVLDPARVGSSALLRGWIESRSVPATWMGLTQEDNVPAIFFSHLAESLRTMVPGIEACLLEQSWNLEDGAVDLINAMAGPTSEWLLVLENYDVIRAPKVHRMVRQMLDRAPAHLHIVIIAEKETPLQLSRLLVRGQLLRVELEDLT